MNQLPHELKAHVVSFVDDAETLKALRLTSRPWVSLTTPKLFLENTINVTASAFATDGTRRPAISALIEDPVFKTMVVKVDYTLATGAQPWSWDAPTIKLHADTLLRGSRWPQLRNLSLSGIIASEQDLSTFINYHARTLRVLTLRDIFIDNYIEFGIESVPNHHRGRGSILSLFSKIRQACRLEAAYLLGHFSNYCCESWKAVTNADVPRMWNNPDFSDWDYARVSDALETGIRPQLESYMLGKWTWPFPFPEGRHDCSFRHSLRSSDNISDESWKPVLYQLPGENCGQNWI